MAALRSLPADALLSRPTGLVVLPSGKLCVAGAHGLALLLESGKRSKQQPRKAPPLDLPTGLACSDSALFVACKGSHQVIKLDLHDNFALVASAGGAGAGTQGLERILLGLKKDGVQELKDVTAKFGIKLGSFVLTVRDLSCYVWQQIYREAR